MPDIVLDYHRYKTPIDHPDGSVTRAKLEYPTIDVSFAYLHAINKLHVPSYVLGGGFHNPLYTVDAFTDKAVEAYHEPGTGDNGINRGRSSSSGWYGENYNTSLATADHYVFKNVAGRDTTLASEAVDLNAYDATLSKLSLSGSTLKAFRNDMTTPKISLTDTSLASGYFGIAYGISGRNPINTLYAYLRAPASSSPSSQAVLELGLEGSGKPEDPFRPSMSKSLAEISTLTGLPDFLYQEAKKYDVLKAKGFTDDEIKVLLGYIPQHQVDLDSVTWGAFELSEKSPTNIIMIYGDNPYKSGAVQRQMDYSKSKNLRVFSPPKGYGEAVALYNKLKSDFKHWLAGKDNFAYMVLGLEELDLMQNVDFYYGELIEHKAHYQQLKQVPDWEMRNRLNELRGRLSKVSVLVDERDKHLKKIDEILKRGW
jgi:hypothetical protein